MLATRIFIVYSLFCFTPLSAQLCYPVVGTYQKKSAQGMAIWKDEAYLFNDGGHCRVLDLLSKNVIREFDLASSGDNTHVNSACFCSTYSENAGCPIIYVSEYKQPSRCFVERISNGVSKLLQTIEFQVCGKSIFVHGWIIDDENKSLYALTRSNSQQKAKKTRKVWIWRFCLPKLDSSTVVLTEKDCEDSFVVEFDNGIQGAKVKGRYMYIATGLQEQSKAKFGSRRAIQIIDLNKREWLKSVDLTYVTMNEPEDIDFYKGECLLYCGQNGGIYKVKL